MLQGKCILLREEDDRKRRKEGAEAGSRRGPDPIKAAVASLQRARQCFAVHHTRLRREALHWLSVAHHRLGNVADRNRAAMEFRLLRAT